MDILIAFIVVIIYIIIRITNFLVKEMLAMRKRKKREKRLREIESLSIMALLEEIKDKDLLFQHKKEKLPIRVKAIQLLGNKGDASVIESLIHLLSDANTDIREETITALARLGDPRAVEPLIRLLSSANPKIREKTITALARLGDPRAVEPLMQALNDPIPTVQSKAKKALEKLGVPSGNVQRFDQPHKPQPITHTDDEEIESLTIEEWIANLDHEDWQFRWKVVEALGEIHDPRIIEPLIQALNDEDWSVRLKVVEALAKIDDVRIVGPLVSALKEKNLDIRRIAAKTLVKIGSSAVEPLMQAFGDQNLRFRKEVATILKKIGVPAVEYLIKALKSKDGDVQWRAVEALGEIGDTRAVAALVRVLDDDDADVRLQAAEVLDKLGWTPQQNQEQIVYHIAKKHWDDLVPFGAQAIPLLMKMVNDKNRKVQEHLTGILKTVCASVDTVIFGESKVNDFDQHTTLANPDVSELAIPMSKLEKIEIHIENYGFHLVERFVTYAVNYIGQEYLREHVEVHIYGDPEKLHPNLRNSLKNLCKCVEMHGGD